MGITSSISTCWLTRRRDRGGDLVLLLMPNHVHIVADGLRRTFRYVALNPVRARLVERAEDWRWSSTRAHIAGESSSYVDVAPALDRVGSFAAFLGEAFDEAMSYAALRKAESVGRPVGSREWLADMEARTGLTLAPAKRGPKPKEDN